MGELFDFRYPGTFRGVTNRAVIEIEIEGLPWAYGMPGVPGEENRYIIYGQDFKVNHEYRIITVDGREQAERIK